MPTILNNRYQIVKSIGVGGMAEVFQAHDLTLDCTVAIKVMKPQLANDDYFVRQFKNEARAAAGLTSPHVVSIRDWVQNDEGNYIVMEYVRGIDLKHVIAKYGAIDPAKVAEIASQVCHALKEAHERSIVHRDIKTANIMLQASGDIKVMDFGIAQSKRHSTSEGGQPIVGTVSYMSPEQIRGEAAAPSNDIYSLGAVMYELLTARLPIMGDNIKDVARRQLNEDPVEPMELNPAIDADLNAIVMKALAKDPAQRYQSATALRKDLLRYLSAPEHEPNPHQFPLFWVIAVTKSGDESQVGSMFKVDSPRVIGRSEQADIRITDSTVSNKHVRVTPFGTRLEIEDLNSSNGTIIDGKFIHRKVLCQAGTNIDLGKTRIRLGKKS